jgi:hypothetical protein
MMVDLGGGAAAPRTSSHRPKLERLAKEQRREHAEAGFIHKKTGRSAS